MKGVMTPEKIREKLKTNEEFRKRTIEHLTKILSECLPEEVMDENISNGEYIFQPLLHPMNDEFFKKNEN